MFTENEAQAIWDARIKKKKEYFDKIREEAERAQYEKLKKKFNNNNLGGNDKSTTCKPRQARHEQDG